MTIAWLQAIFKEQNLLNSTTNRGSIGTIPQKNFPCCETSSMQTARGWWSKTFVGITHKRTRRLLQFRCLLRSTESEWLKAFEAYGKMIWITIGQNEINQAEKFCFVNIDKIQWMIYVEICKFSSEQNTSRSSAQNAELFCFLSCLRRFLFAFRRLKVINELHIISFQLSRKGTLNRRICGFSESTAMMQQHRRL